MSKKFKDVNEDFADFLSAPDIIPPTHVFERIFASLKNEIYPSRRAVFFKVCSIHAFVSVFVLSLCSQLGIQAFRIFDAMNTFMKIVGHTYCEFLCGAFYFAISSFVLNIFLKPQEVRVVRRDRFTQLLILVGVSMGFLLCFNMKVLLFTGVIWILGSMIGGLSMLEIGWQLRLKIRRTVFYRI